MTTSTNESSNSSFFITRFFNEDMKQDLSTMMEMVKEMYEDGRKSSILREAVAFRQTAGNGEATSYCKYEPENDA